MRSLPTGTITMLFSDIEGSTALLNRLGDKYANTLFQQQALVRRAIAANNGLEMGTEGDSFFVVFESAIDALRCCVAAQHSMSTNIWPEGVTVRIRMGLHSGEPTRHENVYVGLDVHRAARIAATAHGGQVVLSETTRQLVELQLPAGVSLKDLGYHRLKDLEALEHAYQLLIVGLEEGFPPLKSLGAETNLPSQMTQLVGRSSEVEQLCVAVQAPEIRLITLTGAGGVGKTRLALAAASSLGHVFRDGIYFISLSGVRDEEAMWSTIGDSLNVSSEGAPADAVVVHVADRQTLLVLDNLEQIPAAPAVVATLLAASGHLIVLTTSRGPLHLLGEHEQVVMPLQVPKEAALEEIVTCSAVRLFVQQARMVRPGFTLDAGNAAYVASICRSVDGLPLAIELAAARVRLLTPRALLARLGNNLELAAADVGRRSRQQTLRATIEWSYQLLSSETAQILRRMGVFVGGCDLEALTAVAVQDAGADALAIAQELLDVSLITIGEGVDGDPRVDMLETIREYALECLSRTGELEATRLRHANHYAHVAEHANEQLSGPAQLIALDRLEAEHDNLRAALRFSFSSEDGVLIRLRLVEALGLFWYRHSHASEGRSWLLQALEVTSDDAAPHLCTIAHYLGLMLDQQGDTEGALAYLERSLVIARELDDPNQQARELNSLGIIQHRRGGLEQARSLLEDSVAIARSIGDNSRLATALTNLGHVESASGNYFRSIEVLEEALKLDTASGDMFGVALDQQSLAATRLRLGQAEHANDVLSSMLGFLSSSGEIEFLTTTLELSACISAELGDGLYAARLSGAAEGLRLKSSIPITGRAAAELERYLTRARTTVSSAEWDGAMNACRDLSKEEMIQLLLTSSERHRPATSA